VDVARFTPEGPCVTRADIPRPVFAYVGRVAVEKNLTAFLRLQLPGSKWVVGGGPQLAALKRDFPDVHFAGAVDHHDLPAYYRCADAFVFPSLTDTFGLVLLEALACGVPVAAFPVAGPADVVGTSGSGVLDHDLKRAALGALEVPRAAARAHAMKFSWERVASVFLGHLAPFKAITT
jgi:glycosyltransferase involved in cell wall biosynthesis